MIFPVNIIQAPVIHIKLKAPLFFMNKIGVLIGELFVQINPLFNNLLKVFYNTNNSL